MVGKFENEGQKDEKREKEWAACKAKFMEEKMPVRPDRQGRFTLKFKLLVLL
jgi:hypothetical protein